MGQLLWDEPLAITAVAEEGHAVVYVRAQCMRTETVLDCALKR